MSSRARELVDELMAILFVLGLFWVGGQITYVACRIVFGH